MFTISSEVFFSWPGLRLIFGWIDRTMLLINIDLDNSIYLDTMTGGGDCSQFRLLLYSSFIGQYFPPVGGEGVKEVDGGYGYIIQLTIY